MKIWAIVGDSKSGKTKLIRQLVPEFKKRGYSVAVIKHCSKGFDLDKKGKDSWKFVESGADGVAMLSPDQLALIQRKKERVNLDGVARDFFKDMDIVLIEGGKQETNLKKIEVLGQGVAEKLESPLEELEAIVSDKKMSLPKPVFRPHQISQIADFLESKLEGNEPCVFLDVDGASIRLNPFVHKIFENVLWGMVKSLQGIKENAQRMTLSLIRRDKR